MVGVVVGVVLFTLEIEGIDYVGELRKPKRQNKNAQKIPEPHSVQRACLSFLKLNHRISWESAGTPVQPTMRSTSCILETGQSPPDVWADNEVRT